MDPELEKRLRSQGYSDRDIENAKLFYARRAQEENQGPPSPKKPQHQVPQSPWAFIRNLFSSGSLY